MRKKYILGSLVILMTLFAAACCVYMQNDRLVLTVGGGYAPQMTVRTPQSVNTIALWQDETDGRGWFFLPSCVRQQKFVLGDIGTNSLRIDGELLEKGDVYTWEEGQSYEMQVVDEAYQVHSYTISFMRSENIPAVFISTESGSMAYLEADKANEETGDICVVHEDGNTEYQGALERISGRGNSTWEYYDKKPYAIKLSEKYPLCGLDSGDRWRLLALCRESSKLDNKLAMDLAGELGLAYSVQGTWVDLYLNGQYAGNYLLTESVTVGDGRVDITDLEKENERANEDIDNAAYYEEENNKGYLIENESDITGGYLIEKDISYYYEFERNGFVTSTGMTFTINEPGHASREQVQYIGGCVERIDQLAQSMQPEVWDYLDADSFVRKFLIDEISLNMDVGFTSVYFYKERNDSKLYSGPIWDYDNAFGDGESYLHEGYDYEHTVVEDCNSGGNRLNWYTRLYETEEVQSRLAKEYTRILPLCEKLLDSGIDEYAQTIRASVMMDRLRWLSGEEQRDVAYGGRYSSYDNNVRYTKFFLAKRLNWLCDRWGVEHEEFQTPSNGQVHTVTFANYDGVVGTVQVPDGAELGEPLAYDEAVYQGWEDRSTGEKYKRQIPVYEDMVFYNAKWE